MTDPEVTRWWPPIPGWRYSIADVRALMNGLPPVDGPLPPLTRRSAASAAEPTTRSVPAPLIEAQTAAILSILPNPDETIAVTVICRKCGATLATSRLIANSPLCPVLVVGTRRSTALIDYDRDRSLQRGTQRRQMTSSTEYSIALHHSTTPAKLPLWCDVDGDREIQTSRLSAMAPATIRV